MNEPFKKKGGKCARLLTGAITIVAAIVIGTPASASASPYFIPRPAYLSVKDSGSCLTANSQSFNNTDRLYTSNCHLKWTEQLWDVNSVGGGYYNVRSRLNGQCLDVLAYRQENGAQVVTWPCKPGATNQQWSLDDNSFGGYNLRARHSGKCLGIYKGSPPWVFQFQCVNNPTQAWYVTGAGR